MDCKECMIDFSGIVMAFKFCMDIPSVVCREIEALIQER